MKPAVLLVALAACTRPSDHRAEAELEVGKAELTDATVVVIDGLAAVRLLTDHRLELWGNAPVLDITLDLGATAAGRWTLVVRNALEDDLLVVDGAPAIAPEPLDDGATVVQFEMNLSSGPHALRVAPPDADLPGRFEVAAMADIQTAMPEVDDVFRAISELPDARFVVAMGDITERAEDDEYDLFERQLAYLRIPYFTTLGNHELWAPAERYFERFGRASFQFWFKDVAFTFADTGDAAIDPLVNEWLTGWLGKARHKTHVFLTHIPPIDPIGLRYGGFRSTRDGQRLLGELSDGLVDLTLYGHIHTFIEYENAGIPAFVSGGGGAQPMKLDGIDRHFLVITFDATQTAAVPLLDDIQGLPGGVRKVELHRVDDSNPVNGR